jgi:hypothetical protein
MYVMTRDALGRLPTSYFHDSSINGIGQISRTPVLVREALHLQTGPWDPVSEIDQALKAKNWGQALELAIEAGQRDEVELTNLIFFAQNPQLPRAPLDPKTKNFKTLSGEWRTIQTKDVHSAIERMSVDNDLAVHGKLVAERDPQFWGANGKTFRDVVRSVAAEVDLNPGFLSAVLLAEVGSAAPYLKRGPVLSFFTGTDDFFAQRKRLKTHVPAFANVHFDKTRTFENINETGRKVKSILFDTGKDAARATAVYLAYAQLKLRAAAKTNGGDFDALPVQVQFALMRIAMAAGHGGIELNGNFVWFLKKGDKSNQVKAGTKGAVLVGVARWIDRVLKGEDIFIRDWTGRTFPNTAKATSRNATILVAQALHLSDWHFGIPLTQRPKRPVRPW